MHISFFCSVLTCLGFVPGSVALVDKWTPAEFDWNDLQVNHTLENSMWMSKSDVLNTTNLSRVPTHLPTKLDVEGNELFPVAAALGLAWRAAGVAAFGIGLSDTIKSCKQTANKEAGVGPCLKGIFTTVVGFGGALSANKDLLHKGGSLILPNVFRPDGTVDLTQNILTRREAIAQDEHDRFIFHHIRGLSSKEPEFLGYAEKDHRLAERDFGKHPFVPMVRFEHFKYGSMELATRDTHNGTFVSMAHAGHPTHLLGRRQIQQKRDLLKRQEVYDKETFNQGVVEARFDTEASNADPGKIKADSGSLFNAFEPDIECFVHGTDVKGKSILDAQMFDTANEATFGWGSIGIYHDADDAHSIENTTPAGMPLKQCKN